MSEPKTRKKYTPEFKAQAVAMVGIGRTVPAVAEDLEIGTSILYRWLGKPQGAHLGRKADEAVGEEDTAAEVRSLRGENAQLRMENDILKKAAVILGTRPQPRDVK